MGNIELIKEKKSELSTKLDLFSGKIREALPSMIDQKVMISYVLTAWERNPKLRECTVPSILSATLEASQAGLMPDSFMGECYFVPYGNKCQFIPGYKGLRKLAYRSGKVKECYAVTVYKDDDFEYELGVNRFMKHKRNDEAEQSDTNITHFYAVIKYRDGGEDWLVMNKKVVDYIKSKSPGAKTNDSPWKQWYNKMGEKTVLKQLLNQSELSTEDKRLSRVIALDDLADAGKDQKLILEIDSDYLADDLKGDFEKEKEDDQHREVEEKAADARKNVASNAIKTKQTL